MSKVAWTDDLSVGVGLIDEQHKALIQRLNDVGDAVEAFQGARAVSQTLDFLVDYTNYHFSEEVKHMEKSGYPGVAQHKAKHVEFTNTLGELAQDFIEEGATTSLANSINTLLGNWLVNHIRTVDKEFGNYVAQEGITITGNA